MSKRARHQPGFYATLLNDVRHRGLNSKYQPKVKPTVITVFELNPDLLLKNTYCREK